MPKIQWTDLPPALRSHLFDRLRERQIAAEDLYRLKLWRESEPDAPDGAWYKDFGSFKLCGEGRWPKTFYSGARRREGDACRGVQAVVERGETAQHGEKLRRRARGSAAAHGRRDVELPSLDQRLGDFKGDGVVGEPKRAAVA